MPITEERTSHFYHYTNEVGWRGIVKDKKVKASLVMDVGDERFKAGVYLTKVGPHSGSWASTCFTVFGKSRYVAPVYAVEIILPVHKMKRVRNGYLYPNALDLKKVKAWKVIRLNA